MPRLLSLVVLLLCALSSALAQPAKRPPNIVLILADDLGINDLSCYGRKDQPTPHLDKLARQGMRFTCAYCAQPICSPSRAALMTGKTPARLHLTTFLPGRTDTAAQKLLHPTIRQQLALEEITLAEYLRELGYATALVGKWHLGNMGFMPKDQGFQMVFSPPAGTTPSDTEGGRAEYALTNKAIEFVEANKDRPFFLYLPHYTPHIPLAAKNKLVEKHKQAFNPIYAAMMETMDDTIGMLLARLDELGLSENTIVIFTSDNGGLHILEGAHSPATYNFPFRAGKGFLYEGGVRIPFIIRWPGHIPAGKTEDTPIVNTDVVPTLLEMCGRKTATKLDGVSFAKLLQGGKLEPRPLFWHFPHYTNQGSRPSGSMRDGDWVLIETYDDGKLELYDLARDISQTKNLASEHAERAATMKNRLGQWRKEVGAQENTPNPKFDPALFKKLYVDIDVSSLAARPTAAEMEPMLRSWRQTMDAVLPMKKKK